jgi:hypothetical protein
MFRQSAKSHGVTGRLYYFQERWAQSYWRATKTLISLTAYDFSHRAVFARFFPSPPTCSDTSDIVNSAIEIEAFSIDGIFQMLLARSATARFGRVRPHAFAGERP